MKLLTIDEVCEILRVSKPTGYNLIHSEGFPKIKLGRAWRVEEELLNRWVREKIINEAS
ncbi:helix-turn-helix domain-containing protein [Anaerosporomusa subterranea]|uniref:helix-turn-helix domain-containing protein n=1 Tax=Anaerosporomusa subterranea TaxID=1794912 RepID=UPI000942BD37|nr:helix-turn-helix domain-containing protein [Anaerosporomusa subterranea]